MFPSNQAHLQSSLLDLLCQAAQILARQEDASDDQVESFIQSCWTDYSTIEKIVKDGDSKIAQNGLSSRSASMNDEVGIVAILDYLIFSQGKGRDVILERLMTSLPFIPTLCFRITEATEAALTQVEDFMFELASRMLKTCHRFPEWKDRLCHFLWEWLFAFVSHFGPQTPVSHSKVAIAGMIGILSSFNLSDSKILIGITKPVEDLTSKLCDVQTLSAIEKASSYQAPDRNVPTYTIDSFSVTRLLRTLFTSLGDILIGQLLPEDSDVDRFEDGWEMLKHPDFAFKPRQMNNLSSLVKILNRIVWDQSWRIHLLDLFPDPQDVHDVFPFALQVSVICSLLSADISKSVGRDMRLLVEEKLIFLDFMPLEVYLVAFDALAILATAYPDESTATYTVLSHFLLDPAPIFAVCDDESMCVALREAASRSLACVLLSKSSSPLSKAEKVTVADAEPSEYSSKRAALYSFVNTMQSIPKDGSNDNSITSKMSRRLQNAVCGIANICFILKPREVVDVALPALARRLDGKSPATDQMILETMGLIARSRDLVVFQDVISYLLDKTRKFSEPILKICCDIADVASRPSEYLEVLLEKLLIFFLEKATAFQRENVSESVLLGELKIVVLAIYKVCRHSHFNPQISVTSPEITILMRDFWFYIILFVSKGTDAWPHDWHSMLVIIASKTGPFLFDKSRRSLEADLGSNSVLRATFPDFVVNRIRPNLSAISPPGTDVRVLPFPSCVYLLTVYRFEMIRVKNMSIDFTLSYLADERLNTPEISPILQHICKQICATFIEKYVPKISEKKMVENHIRSILLFCAHRLERVRKFCSELLFNFLATVPKFLFSQSLVHLMLDILRFLDDGKRGKSWDMVRWSVLDKLSYLNADEIASASNDFFLACERWLLQTVKISAPETIGIVQAYMVHISNKSPYTSLNEDSELMRLVGQVGKYSDIVSTVVKSPAKHARYIGEVKGMIMYMESDPSCVNLKKEPIMRKVAQRIRDNLNAVFKTKNEPNYEQRLNQAMFRAGAVILLSKKIETELIQIICSAPKVKFDIVTMEISVEIWSWLTAARPELVKRMLGYLTRIWDQVSARGDGIYNSQLNAKSPFMQKMTYGSPPTSDNHGIHSNAHALWTQFYSSRFKSDKFRSIERLKLYSDWFIVATNREIANGWKCREARFDLALLGTQIATELDRRRDPEAPYIWTRIFQLALGWFESPPMFGDVKLAELNKLIGFCNLMKRTKFAVFQTSGLSSCFYENYKTIRVQFSDAQTLLVLLLENEIARLRTWLYPREDELPNLTNTTSINERTVKWNGIVRTAWAITPLVAIQLRDRFVNSADAIEQELSEISFMKEIAVLQSPEAVSMVLRHASRHKSDEQLRFLFFWTAVPPIEAISLISQSQKIHPWVLQYAVRVLDQFPIDQVFFYVPQLVQALRYDSGGYIEKFILDASKSSQLFTHQIIWNMKANMFKDEACEIPDSLQPKLESIMNKMISTLSGSDKEFYEREFRFFAEVTGISGKLKPLVQADASKAEKKRKIDEEMHKIKVEVGVYLPTNPDSIVVDIDYNSGRPLQSHAKAPFMATFAVQPASAVHHSREPTWMSSIFKVGDDCRQDVLALQMISIFQRIFISSGMDLYTFPYRVIATAPGCGVIEVIPRSISRDMIGREKVNSLYDWFIAEFGPPDSLDFQRAQYEFVKSLAAYSVVLFILQVKDRHNGNIMFDKEGHLIHIDFGFILSIAPGGGILEGSPFKLTTEMVQVMGGDINSPAYQLFSQLCIKAYLSCRPYAEEMVKMVSLMMDSGLPCFKGEFTIRKLRERFLLDKSEHAAAEFMMGCIRQSHENTRSGLYDRFQYMQNGIPY